MSWIVSKQIYHSQHCAPFASFLHELITFTFLFAFLPHRKDLFIEVQAFCIEWLGTGRLSDGTLWESTRAGSLGRLGAMFGSVQI